MEEAPPRDCTSLLFHTQQASYITEYPHSMANSIFLSKERNKVQFTVNISLTRLLLWQIFTNFQTSQDTFRSNRPLRCLGSPINASTDTLKLGGFRHLKRAACSTFPGTIARYLIKGDEALTSVQFVLIWKDTEMPDETARQHDLEALQEELADVLDWKAALYSTNEALMYT